MEWTAQCSLYCSRIGCTFLSRQLVSWTVDTRRDPGDYPCTTASGLGAGECGLLFSPGLDDAAPFTRSFSSSSPRANSSSLEILPASTSARIERWALYSLFS